jgi:hypothetical protein
LKSHEDFKQYHEEEPFGSICFHTLLPLRVVRYENFVGAANDQGQEMDMSQCQVQH